MVQAITEYASPRTKHDVHSFLGIVYYYSGIAGPLTDLLNDSHLDPVNWTDECQTACRRTMEGTATALEGESTRD